MPGPPSGQEFAIVARSADQRPTCGRIARAAYRVSQSRDKGVADEMSSTRTVPETQLMQKVELSPDRAWRALRRYGRWPLLRDAVIRFRYGDGFSHARAIGLQLCLAAVPLLIALQGLATKLGFRSGGRVVAETVLALTPGASESLVTELLGNDERIQDVGEVALVLGLLTAVVALCSAVAQVERGANRIYGVERDRPFAQKYLRALILTFAAGIPALISFLMLVAGGAIGAAMTSSYHWGGTATTTWNIVRWPLSVALTVASVSVLFRYAPRRRQPGMTWVMIGGTVATVLWWLVSLLLAGYITWSGMFGDTYGPLTAVMALLLWAFLTAVALLLGLAFAAQLEARRVGVPEPAVPDQWQPAREEAGVSGHRE